ncbi:SUKH-3 domain-containing protein [Micromonospora phytophila]|uniref:SUKH-3 domain-containing protein n=1 Tax=Micromonospora phytophila TaxID=709888 RepID=UPI00202E6D3C|nr:SUKH-3 domain-containing protein [Micromonospora phytophila]MCM0676252.1 SUKH-3 domain-containing protein [Micromonospora phytophila]
MIDRHQAEQLAAVWARRDSQRLGHECRPTVDEFDLGYVITSTVAVGTDDPRRTADHRGGQADRRGDHLAAGAGRRGGADVPAEPPAGPTAPRTVDPASQLLREIRRLPTPNTAAHLTVEGRLFRAQGAKGDIALNHHPLVRTYLDELPAGHLVRGGDRHAELIVVSEVLHEYDHRRAAEGIAPLGMADAKGLLETARFEVFRVREPGDPNGGPADRPCDSCVDVLVDFNVLPWSDRAFTMPWHPEQQPDPDPGRFPPDVAQALVAAGWRPHFGDEIVAMSAIRDVSAVSGSTSAHADFPAALAMLRAFPSLVGARRGLGEQVWISRFDIRPRQVAHTADTLADFAAVLGVRLFPIGTERQESILAVDEHGRIFALDQAGEWFLGEDIDAALTTLLLGRAPAPVRDDGTW